MKRKIKIAGDCEPGDMCYLGGAWRGVLRVATSSFWIDVGELMLCVSKDAELQTASFLTIHGVCLLWSPEVEKLEC